MITEFRHVGLTVQNLEECRTFFVDTLGFEISKEMDESGGYIDAMHNLNDVLVTTVKLKAPDGGMVELLKFRSHKIDGDETWNNKIYSTGLTHIALTVADLEQTYSELTKKGVKFNAPPQDSPDGYAKVTFCRGPENLFIELVEVKQ